MDPIQIEQRKSFVDDEESLTMCFSYMIERRDLDCFLDREDAEEIFEDYLTNCRYLNIARVAAREGIIERIVREAKEKAGFQQKVFEYSMEIMIDELAMNHDTVAEVLLSFQAAVNKSVLDTKRGKSICHQLKQMRRRFADENGIDFEEEECQHDGPCAGTCPYCDAKTRELTRKAGLLDKPAVYPSSKVSSTTRRKENEPDIWDDVEGMMSIVD